MGFLFRTDLREHEKVISDNLRNLTIEAKRLVGRGVYAIILSGSLGKGQGSGYMEDGKLRLVGDYDIVCITKGIMASLFPPKTPYMKNFRFPQANAPATISLIPSRKLPRLDASVEYLDWLNSRFLLYGNRNTFDRIKVGKDRPRSHALEIILNRFMYIVKEITDCKKEKDLIEMGHGFAKAVVGAGDAKLFIRNEYVSDFNDKLDNLKSFEKKSSVKSFSRALKILKYPEKVKSLDRFFDKVKKSVEEGLLYVTGSESVQGALKGVVEIKDADSFGKGGAKVPATYVFLLKSLGIKNGKLQIVDTEALQQAHYSLEDSSVEGSEMKLWKNLRDAVDKISRKGF